MPKLSPETLKKLKTSASISNSFRFFDQTFEIRTDTKEVVKSFKEIFKRFHLSDQYPQASGDYYILSQQNFLNRPLLIVEKRIFFLDNECDLSGLAYMKIMDSVLSKIESHTLFHGASLSYKGQGVILPAASKSGKSTTAMELVKRGFSFLSDDIAALSRKDQLLYPFPKKVGLLPNTLKNFPEIDSNNLYLFPMLRGGDGDEKKLIDIEDLFKKSPGKPCTLSKLIFLGTIPEKRRFRGKGLHSLFVALNRLPENLIAELKQEPGVFEVSIFPAKQQEPVVKVLWKEPFMGLSRVEDVCYLNDTIILDHSNGQENKPDFSGMPKLEKISKTQAMFELLKEMKGGQKASLLQKECRGSAPRLMITLGQMFKNVECYYLTPGRLKERADLVCALCGFNS